MGWSAAFTYSCAFVLFLVSTALEDMEQRELTFDEIADKSLMEQRELTIDEIADKSLMEQREVTFDDIDEVYQQHDILQKPVTFTHRLSINPIDTVNKLDKVQYSIFNGLPGHNVIVSTVQMEEDPASLIPDRLRGQRKQGRRRFAPRSFYPPTLDYPVQFPPGRPTLGNHQAICLYGDLRPRYPDSYFPESGFGSQKLRANAVNHAEFVFSLCCKENQTREQEVTLCCLRQAWKLAVESFCEEDVSIKHSIYHCCHQRGNDRLKCFADDAPNPDYEPTEVEAVSPISFTSDFIFDPNTCQRSEMIPRSSRVKNRRRPLQPTPTNRNVSISFPPGRPTSATIKSLCQSQKLRPYYDIKCLPHKGYGWLARQSKAINRVEGGFKLCCKGKREVLTCADVKWREEMDRFCTEEQGGKLNYPCCEVQVEERYDCFHSRAPHPGYEAQQRTAATATSEEPSLSQICENRKNIKKSLVGRPFEVVLNQCCPLLSDQRSPCVQEKLEIMSKSLCSARKLRRCCSTSSEVSHQCLYSVLMSAINKATIGPPRLRKCPLS